MNLFFEFKFPPLLTGFCKHHSAQNALINIIEKWKHTLYKDKKVRAMFMHLSKAFNTPYHYLLLAKRNTYGFSFNAIKYVESYLLERFLRVNINNNFSEWRKILLGVPQWSVLGPLLVNILTNDIVFFVQEAYIKTFVDDNSLNSIEDNFKDLKTILKKSCKLLQLWFHENHLVLNRENATT